MSILRKFIIFTDRYPVVRGMLSYALIWPTSSIIQQTIDGRSFKDYDWKKALRFSIFGTFYVAPTMYYWIRLSSRIFPGQNFKTAFIKACVEQVTYAPIGHSSFFFGMSLLEGRSINDSIGEVKAKFWPTYKVAVVVWPVFQSFNYSVIPEKHRLPSVSLFGLVWCSFLAYMHQLDVEKEKLAS